MELVKRKMGSDKHGEVKLIHEVKQELGSARWGEVYWKDRSRDFQRRGGRWTSKCENMRGTSIIVSLRRDEIAQIGRLTGGENFVSKRNKFK